MFKRERERSGSMENALDNSAIQTTRLTDFFDYKRKGRKGKCPQCKTENVGLSKHDLCFSCEQKAEFVFREKLSPTQRQQFFRRPISQGALV